MTTATLRGLLVLTSNGEDDDLLGIVDEKNHHVNILAEWAEDNVGSQQVSVRYYTSTVPLSESEVREAAIRNILGVSSADYGAQYSEITGYLWTDEEFKVGGHDLIEELKGHLGEFLHLEVDLHGKRRKP